ncbi:MAG: hypothetical protein KDE33_18980 [Bacteroidetes bacterium]|nr:hypothetical protein [Bacteroidota bacterium]
MDRFFISSKKGKVKRIPIYRYDFSSDINEQKEQKKKFCKWLTYNPNILLYEIKDTCFFTYIQLPQPETWQYKFVYEKSINPPFDNTSIVSKYLGHLIRHCFQKEFKQYLNRSIFCYEKLEVFPFTLLKCFEYNIEVFPDGEFLIHLLPVSKIVNMGEANHIYFLNLLERNRNNRNTDEMIFTLVEKDSFKRYKLDLLDEDFIIQAWEYCNNRDTKQFHVTFDYHFVSNYSPDIFGKITQDTIKELSSSIDLLIPISKLIEFPDFIELHYKPFLKINVEEPYLKKNLLVGNNTKVSVQKAAYYNGIYQPVHDKVIQPIVVDEGISFANFEELLETFNQGGSIKVLNPIHIPSEDEIDISIFKGLKRKFRQQLLFVVFTRYTLPKDFFQPLMDLKVRFQLYLGNEDLFKLSNFTVKCLEKLGGNLTVIDNTFEPETTYFLGIDLGHFTQGEEKYSNLCTVLFNNKGQLLAYRVVNKIPLNEALSEEALSQAIPFLINHIRQKRLPYPQKFIIHRDGKIHKRDIENIETVLTRKFKINTYDIVEIVKSGYPIIAGFNGDGYYNLESGQVWRMKNKHYAILITNDQVKNKGNVLNPIIIKHRYGNTEFQKIVEQVYWFTKLYTNNLYNSTRLPATTEKANNLAGTSNKQYISTYLA